MSVIKTNLLMLFRDVVVICCENHKNTKIYFEGKKVEVIIVTAGVRYS